jgi:transposase
MMYTCSSLSDLVGLLLPPAADVRLEALEVEPTHSTITLVLTSIQPTSICPGCHQPAPRVHSRYQRTIADLPWACLLVRLHLRVRRFFCQTPGCSHRIFTERLPTVVAPWARRSARLAQQQSALGLDFGGEAAARAGHRLALPASPDTVLRLVHRSPLPERATPSVLGVDDFAKRKGQTYGTILVDLDTHKPVDLLPERSADSLAAWLTEHPGVEIVSRDRSSIYADGITRGAPEAVQVADRFHLLMNLREALEGVVARHYAQLDLPAAETTSSVSPSVAPEVSSAPQFDGHRQADDEHRLTNRARRLARYQEVVALAQKGLTQKVIAERLDLCPKTIRRWLHAGTFPERVPRDKRVTLLDPYVPYLQERWKEGCHNGRHLWRELCAQGYTGSRTLVSDWAAQHRRRDFAQAVQQPSSQPSVSSPAAGSNRERKRSARQATWLLVRERDDLRAEEQDFLDRLLTASPKIALAYDLAQDFRKKLTSRRGEAFDEWREVVRTSELPELQRFADGLNRERASVVAAFSLPYSNGPVEGNVTRLKFIKRQGYGRAGFELLKRRVLAA